MIVNRNHSGHGAAARRHPATGFSMSLIALYVVAGLVYAGLLKLGERLNVSGAAMIFTVSMALAFAFSFGVGLFILMNIAGMLLVKTSMPTARKITAAVAGLTAAAGAFYVMFKLNGAAGRFLFLCIGVGFACLALPFYQKALLHIQGRLYKCRDYFDDGQAFFRGKISRKFMRPLLLCFEFFVINYFSVFSIWTALDRLDGGENTGFEITARLIACAAAAWLMHVKYQDDTLMVNRRVEGADATGTA